MAETSSRRASSSVRRRAAHRARSEDHIMQLDRKEFLQALGAGTVGAAAGRHLGAAAPDVKPKKLERDAIKGATDAVARFVTRTTLADLPADVVQQGKRCLIDGFGVILAGSTSDGSRIVREHVREVGGKSEASIIGTRLRVPAGKAALANGASGHAMDYDDTQLSTTPDRTFGLLTHPTIPALSTSLAVAERVGASGAGFLEAFLVGFEVECKIAEAIDPDHYTRGFHSSGTIGAFGAATAAAKLMKLDAAVVKHLLAITASLSSGIRVNFGSMTKPLHVGRAAESGVFAADLAAHGFTGGDDGLDGAWGFFQVLGGGADLDRLIPALGKPYAIVNPGVSVKPYPCGSLSHPSMDAMLKVVVDHDLKPEQIKAVRVRAGSNVLNPLRYKTAKTELEAKFCLPFLMASLIVRRKAGMAEFTDAFVASEAVQRMMELVTGVFDREIEAQGFDKIRSVIEVDLVDGRRLVQSADQRYRGGPDKPFTRAELRAKFADCAQLVLRPDRIEPAIAAIESIDRLSSVRELVSRLVA
ncbi:MAG: MmgE/PrpD family protein [Acidobacteria bacterium]|nr:MAG: MmgE/PrpD family protein [Acidobacteriota bacterium]